MAKVGLALAVLVSREEHLEPMLELKLAATERGRAELSEALDPARFAPPCVKPASTLA